MTGLSRRPSEKQPEALRRLPGLSPISPALGSPSGVFALLLGALLLAPLLELLLGIGRRFTRYALLFVCHSNHLTRAPLLVFACPCVLPFCGRFLLRLAMGARGISKRQDYLPPGRIILVV